MFPITSEQLVDHDVIVYNDGYYDDLVSIMDNILMHVCF